MTGAPASIRSGTHRFGAWEKGLAGATLLLAVAVTMLAVQLRELRSVHRQAPLSLPVAEATAAPVAEAATTIPVAQRPVASDVAVTPSPPDAFAPDAAGRNARDEPAPPRPLSDAERARLLERLQSLNDVEARSSRATRLRESLGTSGKPAMEYAALTPQEANALVELMVEYTLQADQARTECRLSTSCDERSSAAEADASALRGIDRTIGRAKTQRFIAWGELQGINGVLATLPDAHKVDERTAAELAAIAADERIRAVEGGDRGPYQRRVLERAAQILTPAQLDAVRARNLFSE